MNTVSEIKKTIDASSKNHNIPFSVFKVTGLGPLSILEIANEGLEKLSTKPSLIVLDLEMPRMDGFEFIEAYMQDFSAEERSPILVYSGKDLTDVQRELLEKNVAGMVRKDEVSMDELSSLVKKIYSEENS